MNYEEKIKEIQSYYDKKTGELEQIKKEKEKTEEETLVLKKHLENLLIEKKLIDKSCEQARTDGKQAIEDLSNFCMNQIFEDDTKIYLNIGQKDGIPTIEVEIKTIKDGKEVTILPELDGGGINDIISTSIFVGLGILNLDENKSIYVLDEPSKYISKGIYAEKFAEYLQELLHQLGKQVIISTHDESLAEIGDSSFFLEKDSVTGVTDIIKTK